MSGRDATGGNIRRYRAGSTAGIPASKERATTGPCEEEIGPFLAQAVAPPGAERCRPAPRKAAKPYAARRLAFLDEAEHPPRRAGAGAFGSAFTPFSSVVIKLGMARGYANPFVPCRGS